MRHPRRLVLLAGWLLLQAPADPMDPDTPPMERWRRVKSFDSEQDCQAYREQMMEVGAETGSEGLLEEVKYARCVSEDKVGSGSTTTTTP